MEFVLSPWAVMLFPLILFLAALFWGAPPMALLSELIGVLRKKPFPTRCAQQLSRLALKGHLGFWLLIILGVAVLFVQPIESAQPVYTFFFFFAPLRLTAHPDWISFLEANAALIFVSLLVPLCGTLLLALYDLRWKKAREHRGLHIALGCLASAAIKYSYWTLAVLSVFFFWGTPATLPLSSPLWPLLTLWVPLSLYVAGACALVYLVLRREKDDWGRDYYRFAAPFLAAWHIATGCGVLFWYLWLWMSARQTMNLFLPQIFYPWLASIACLILGILLSLAVRFHENPMRLKGCMFVIFLLTYGQTVTLMLAVWETMNRYLPGWSLPTCMPIILKLLHG